MKEIDFGKETEEDIKFQYITPAIQDAGWTKEKFKFEYGIKHFTGTAGQQRIGKKYLEDYLIPIPPLNEQKRIVDKIEQLFKNIDVLIED